MTPQASHSSSPEQPKAISRLLWAGLILLGEYLGVSFAFDAQAVGARGGPWELFGQMGNLGPLLIVGVTAFLLGRSQKKRNDAEDIRTAPLNKSWLAAHVLSFFAFVGVTSATFGEKAPHGPAALWLGGWGTLGLLTGCTLLLALLGNWKLVQRLITRIVAAGGLLGVVGWAAGTLTTALWSHMARATFLTVSSLLQLTSSELLVDSKRHILELDGFAVTIAPICSGVEGMGLFFVLMGAYLYGLRKEFRFPRALLLLPLGLGAIWFGNSLRIAVLMMVGAHIDAEIAVGTFHSKAGWVFFCGITLAIAALSRSSSFFLRSGAQLASSSPTGRTSVTSPTEDSPNPAAAYLLPLVVWISVGLVTSSFAQGHDPLYGVRLLFAGCALFAFRRHYSELFGRPSVGALLIGVGVGVLWLVYPSLTGQSLEHLALPGPKSSGTRLAWTVTRLLGAVFLIPICEELAFRGFLARRLTGERYWDSEYREMSAVGVLGSSMAFGVVHQQWLLATATGVIFALVVKRGNRLSDGIYCHAAANLTIAVWVLATGQYGYW